MNILYLSIFSCIYIAVIYLIAPKHTTAQQFFWGTSKQGVEPSYILLIASAAISWIFAKSIVNSASLAYSYGLWGAFGYSLYYLSFVVVGIAAYFIAKSGKQSLPSFLQAKYGILALRIFLLVVGFRLINEVWSNTKVIGLFFGGEGSAGYWLSILIFTSFTVFYSIKGGLRGSLITDGIQMLIAAVLLMIVMFAVYPDIVAASTEQLAFTQVEKSAGMTFALLALVQCLSYGFHDPVLTDRAFLLRGKKIISAFIIAGLIGGIFIFLFGYVGIYAKSIGHEGGAIMSSIAGTVSLPLLLVFNVIMLASAGSTIDSTFSSTAKLNAIDWQANKDPMHNDARQKRKGQMLIIVVAVIGSLPLLTYYAADNIGPAIIKATTISGTMIFGLAPVILLSFIRRAGKASFYFSLGCSIFAGTMLAAAPGSIPESLAIGSGKFAISLGVNVYGLCIATLGYLLLAYFLPTRANQAK